jgi:hypothetical protein
VTELFGRSSVEGCWTFGIVLGESPGDRAGNDVAEFLLTALYNNPRCRRAVARMAPANVASGAAASQLIQGQ